MKLPVERNWERIGKEFVRTKNRNSFPDSFPIFAPLCKNAERPLKYNTIIIYFLFFLCFCLCVCVCVKSCVRICARACKEKIPALMVAAPPAPSVAFARTCQLRANSASSPLSMRNDEPVDRAPSPASVAEQRLDGFSDEYVRAYSALVRCLDVLPPRIGLALLRCVWTSPSTPTPADLADLAGVSRSAVVRALSRARARSGLRAASLRVLLAALHAPETPPEMPVDKL